jgi:hypothetical protein
MSSVTFPRLRPYTNSSGVGEAAETNKKLGAFLDTDITICNTYDIRISIIRSARLLMNRRCALQETRLDIISATATMIIRGRQSISINEPGTA